jgi:hypothetical protein
MTILRFQISYLPIFLTSCVWLERIPPGAGELSHNSRVRLEKQSKDANVEGARLACEVALDPQSGLRALLKCGELASAEIDNTTSRKPLLAAFLKLQSRFEHSTDRCQTLPSAGLALSKASQHHEAARLFSLAAHECPQDSFRLALSASSSLFNAQRCDDSVSLIREFWRDARTNEQQISMLDLVAQCSSTFSLPKNLEFVSPDIRERYYALMESRRLEQIARDAEDRAANQRAEARSQLADANSRRASAQDACQSDCSRGVGQCMSSCGGDASCVSRCSAWGSMCQSGCH